MNENQEREILLKLLRAEPVTAVTLDQWLGILRLAQQHRVEAILYRQLKRLELSDQLPPEIWKTLREDYLHGANRNIRIYRELGKILTALNQANISVIPLKGVCLAEAVYGNIALREIGDVDLLVKPGDLEKALAVLRTLGYAAAYPFEIESVRQEDKSMPELSKPGGVTVELHWTIVHPHYTFHFLDSGLDQVWSRATPEKIGGVQVLMLSPMDLLWHLCFHAAVQHLFEGMRLRDFWDIAQTIQRYGDAINWEQFTQCVNQWGIANGVYLALKLAEEWTGVVIPAPVMRSLKPVTLDDATIEWVRQKIWSETDTAVVSNIVPFASKLRIADKLAVLRDILFLSRNSMASRYHVRANSWRIFLYYPMRIKDLLAHYGRAMWQLMRGDKTLTAEASLEARLRQYLGRD